MPGSSPTTPRSISACTTAWAAEVAKADVAAPHVVIVWRHTFDPKPPSLSATRRRNAVTQRQALAPNLVDSDALPDIERRLERGQRQNRRRAANEAIDAGGRHVPMGEGERARRGRANPVKGV